MATSSALARGQAAVKQHVFLGFGSPQVNLAAFSCIIAFSAGVLSVFAWCLWQAESADL